MKNNGIIHLETDMVFKNNEVYQEHLKYRFCDTCKYFRNAKYCITCDDYNNLYEEAKIKNK